MQEAQSQGFARICPLTGDLMQEWLTVPGDYRRPMDRNGYRLYWSSRAQFGQLLPRPTQEQVKSFYEVPEYYTHQEHETQGTGEQVSVSTRFLRHFAWRADYGRNLDRGRLTQLMPIGESRLCDIGAGSGGVLRAALEAGFSEAIGVEPDPVARQVAIKHSLDVRDGTAEAIPPSLEMGTMDVVVMKHVLEHTLDPGLALANAVALLRPGGKMVIETPNNDATGLKIAGRNWPWLDVPRHLNFFTAPSLIAFCEQAELSVEAVEYYGYSRQFSKRWVEEESLIRRRFEERSTGEKSEPGSRWRLLGSTAFAPARRKYDSLRVCAVKI